MRAAVALLALAGGFALGRWHERRARVRRVPPWMGRHIPIREAREGGAL